MKNSCKDIIAALCSVVCMFLMASCHSSLSYNDAIQKNVSRADDPDKHEDARFIADAASSNMLATQLGEEAVKSGYSASLVALARESLEQRKEMGNELKRVARKENFVLPAEMSDEHQKMLTELINADRSDVDRTYIRIMSEISKEEGEMFSRMATEGGSDEIRGFAAHQLSIFDSHKTQLETVDSELLKTTDQ